MKPIPPRTVLKLVKLWPHGTRRHKKGEIWRVGYYSRQDGLNTIWLVNESGQYTWTVDKEFLIKHFEIIALSNETSLYGGKRPHLGKLHSKRGQKEVTPSTLKEVNLKTGQS